MNTSKKPKDTDRANQHARFLETARALGCDEDEAAFDEKLKGIVRERKVESDDRKTSKTEDS